MGGNIVLTFAKGQSRTQCINKEDRCTHSAFHSPLCQCLCVCVSPRQLMLMLSFLVFHILSLSRSVFVLYKISSSLRGLKIISLNDNRIKTIDCTRLILG